MFEVAQLGASLGLDASQYNQGLDDAEKRAQSFGASYISTIQRIGEIALGVFTGDVIKRFVDSITGIVPAAIATAARTETLGISLQEVGKRAGYTSEQLNAYVEAIKKNGITTQEATTAALRFIQANLDVAQASKLARVAQDLAVIAGKNSSESFTTLTYAISSMQPILLKQFGIQGNLNDIMAESGNELGIYSKGVNKAGQTVGHWTREMTAAERQQSMLNFILAEGAKVSGTYEAAMTTVGKKTASLARYQEEALEKLGKYFLSYQGIIIDTKTLLLKTFASLPDPFKAFGIDISGTLDTLTAPLTKLFKYLNEVSSVWTRTFSEDSAAGREVATRQLATYGDIFSHAMEMIFGPAVQGPIAAVREALAGIGQAFKVVAEGAQAAWKAVKPFVDTIGRWLAANVKLNDMLTVFGIILASAIVPQLIALAGSLTGLLAPLGLLTAAAVIVRQAWEADFLGIATAVKAAGEAIGLFVAIFQQNATEIARLLPTVSHNIDMIFGAGVTAKMMQWAESARVAIGKFMEALKTGLATGDFSGVGKQLSAMWQGLVTWWDTGGGKQLAKDIAGRVATWVTGSLFPELGRIVGRLLAGAGALLGQLWQGIVTWWDTDGQAMVAQTLARVDAWITTKLIPELKANAPKWAVAVRGALSGIWEILPPTAQGIVGAAVAIETLRAAFSGIAAVIPSVAGIVGVISDLRNMGVTLAMVGTAIGTAIGPLLIATAVLAAVGVAAYLVIKNWDAVSAFFVDLGKRIQTALQPAIAYLQPTFARIGEMFTGLPALLAPIVADLQEFGRQISAVLVPILIAAKPIIEAVLGAALTEVGVAISFIIKVIGELIVNVIPGAISAFGGLIKITIGVVTGIGNIVTILAELSKGLRGQAVDATVMERAWQQLQVSLGQIVIGIGVIMTALVTTITGAIAGIFRDLPNDAGKGVAAAMDKVGAAATADLERLKKQLGQGAPAADMIDRMAASSKKAAPAIAAVVPPMRAVNEIAKTTAGSLDMTKLSAIQLANANDVLNASLAATPSAMSALSDAQLQAMIDHQEKQKALADTFEIMSKLSGDKKKVKDDEDRSAALAAWQTYYEKLKGIASSAVDAGRASIEKLIPEGALGDKIKESLGLGKGIDDPNGPLQLMRRMMDVAVNGMKSQWAEGLSKIVPDLDQAKAKQIVADYLAGNWTPDVRALIWDKMVAFVKEQGLAKEALDKLISEIATAAGQSTDSTAAALLGIKGGKMAGVEAAAATAASQIGPPVVAATSKIILEGADQTGIDWVERYRRSVTAALQTPWPASEIPTPTPGGKAPGKESLLPYVPETGAGVAQAPVLAQQIQVPVAATEKIGGDMAAGIIAGIVTALTTLPELGLQLLTGLLAAFGFAVTTNVQLFLTTGAQIMGAISGAITTNAQLLLDTGSAILNAILTGLAPVDAKAFAALVIEKINTYILAPMRSTLTDFTTIGSNIIEALYNGIVAAWGVMIKKFEDLVALLPDVVKRILGIASPSTVFAEMGKNTMTGYAEGVGAAADKARSALTDAFGNLPSPTVKVGYQAAAPLTGLAEKSNPFTTPETGRNFAFTINAYGADADTTKRGVLAALAEAGVY